MKTKKYNLKYGRLEMLMQGIANEIKSANSKNLKSFITYNNRSKTISATKRFYKKNGPLSNTPENSFYDLIKNNNNFFLRFTNFDFYRWL